MLTKAQAALYGEEIPAMILFGTGLDLDSAADDTYFPGGLTCYLNCPFARLDKGAMCRSR